MMYPIRIGIIGLGKISAVHIRAYRNNEHVVLHSLAENNDRLLNIHNNVVLKDRLYTDYRLMLKDPDLDVVSVLLPHHLHAAVIMDVLKAGKHVICEKPLVTDPKDIHEIKRLSSKMGRYVYLKQYFRFSDLHHKAMRMVLDGSIGTPYLITCLYTVDATNELNNAFSWRFNSHEGGGGVFMDVGVHMLDYLQEFLGNPLSVTAITQNSFTSLPQKGEDVSVVTLAYRGGIIANIVCTAGDSSYGFRWEKKFFGTSGSICIDDAGKQSMRLSVHKNAAIIMQKEERDWWERANISALNDIISRIAKNEPPAINLDDAQKTLQVVRDAYRSNRSEKTIFF